MNLLDDLLFKSGYVIVICSIVPLAASSVAALAVAVIQTATQVQEQTVTYLARLIVIVLMYIVCGQWFLAEFIEFLQGSLAALASV